MSNITDQTNKTNFMNNLLNLKGNYKFTFEDSNIFLRFECIDLFEKYNINCQWEEFCNLYFIYLPIVDSNSLSHEIKFELLSKLINLNLIRLEIEVDNISYYDIEIISTDLENNIWVLNNNFRNVLRNYEVVYESESKTLILKYESNSGSLYLKSINELHKSTEFQILNWLVGTDSKEEDILLYYKIGVFKGFETIERYLETSYKLTVCY